MPPLSALSPLIRVPSATVLGTVLVIDIDESGKMSNAFAIQRNRKGDIDADDDYNTRRIIARQGMS